MRSSTSVIWRVECLAGVLHSQDWHGWPSGRDAFSAEVQRLSVDAGTVARMEAAVSRSRSVKAAAARARMSRSRSMSSLWSYNHCRACVSKRSRSAHCATSSRSTRTKARRWCSVIQRKPRHSQACCWWSNRVRPRAYSARTEARSGAAMLNSRPRCASKTVGTARTLFSGRPLMRTKPMCSAKPNLRLSPRRRAISSCSTALKLKKACSSNWLSSRGISRWPR